LTAPATSERLTITVAEGLTVSAIFVTSAEAWACYVLAHGAGAGMTHPFLEAVASELGDRGIATLRYNFPFVERRSKRPDSPAIAHATIQAAVMKAREIAPELPLIAGGKSFGGRMTSQAQASSPLPAVRGLADLDHLRSLDERLGERATLVELQDADHSFHVPARTGRKDGDVRAELLNALTAWTRGSSRDPLETVS
jgi:uncharacterized protein